MGAKQARIAVAATLALCAAWALIPAAGTGAAPASRPAATGPATKPRTGPATRPTAVKDPRAAVARAKADIANLETVLDTFEIDVGRYPTSDEGLKALVEQPPGLKSWHGPYLQQLRDDPWGHAYRYQFPGTHNPNGYDVSSAGPDGRAGTRDDIGNW